MSARVLQLRGLFASVCDLRVTLKMWDVYLQHADPFLVFFLALVILVNAKYVVVSHRSTQVRWIERMISNSL